MSVRLNDARGAIVTVVRVGDPAQSGRFKVDATMKGCVVLSPEGMDDRSFAMRLLDREVVEISIATGRGVSAGRARVQRWVRAQRLLFVDDPSPMQHLQRRQLLRVDADIPVQVSFIRNHDLVTTLARTVNIAASGMKLRLRDSPRPGEEFAALLRLPDQPVLLVAKVLVRDEENFTVRCEFVQGFQTDLDKLAAFVMKSEHKKTR